MADGTVTPEEVKEFDKRKGVVDRLFNLHKALCRVNCKPLLHRPSCKSMKKDIEFLKETLL